MKRAGLLALPLGVALALPVLPLSGQDAEAENEAAQVATEQNFPWPTFVTADPQPGRYRITTLIENFAIPLPESEKESPQPGTSIDEVDIEYVCLAGDVERVDWLTELSGPGTCTSDGATGDDSSFRLAVDCVEPGGGGNQVLVTGSASDQGIDMQMAMIMRMPDMEKMSMDWRIMVERVGECE